MTIQPVPRLLAALIALAALVSLALQFHAEWLEMGDTASTGAVIWSMARYFTILTNAAVAVVFGLTALYGRWPGASWPAGVTVWIVAVGAVYHALLSATHNPQGWEVWSNIGLHSIVPLGCLALWLTSAPKTSLTYAAPLIWTIWPLTYAAYAIARGLDDGKFPYFFLDPAKSGVPVVAAYVVGLGVFFVASGGLLVLIAQRSAQKVPA